MADTNQTTITVPDGAAATVAPTVGSGGLALATSTSAYFKVLDGWQNMRVIFNAVWTGTNYTGGGADLAAILRDYRIKSKVSSIEQYYIASVDTSNGCLYGVSNVKGTDPMKVLAFASAGTQLTEEAFPQANLDDVMRIEVYIPKLGARV